MKNRIGILAFLILLMAPVGLSQFTTTANLGFRKPNQGITTNWNVYINGNFDELDSILSGFSILTSNSPTPSVLNSSHWTADNSVPTIITNFTGGYSGQLITVLCQDTVTLINASPSINLNGSFNCTTGISISFILINSIWIETSRVQTGGSGIDTALLSGSNTYTGNNTFSGSTSLATENGGAVLHADQFLNVQAAINNCPPAGCIVDATSPNVNFSLGLLDPNTKDVTILLGPYTYLVTTITIRTNLHIYGVSSGGPTVSGTGTTLQSNNNTLPMFILSPTAPVGGLLAATNFRIAGMRVYCGASNSNQVAFNILAQSGGGGLWYSYFEDINVGGDGIHSCGGGNFLLDGSAGGSPPGINQFLDFKNVQAFRSVGGAPDLLVKGVGGQMTFEQDEFDGGATKDTLPNVVIEDSTFAGFVAPYTFAFTGSTFQRAGVAIQLRGVSNFSCDNCHFENVSGGINMAIGQHYGNFGNTVRNSFFATAAAQNSGAGYIVTMDANSQLSFDDNAFYGNPDNFFLGDLRFLEHRGLMNISDGLPYGAPNSSMRVPVGFDCDSPGFKCALVSTGAISSNSRASVAITWTTPFLDNGYNVVCSVDDFTTAATTQGVTFERLNGLPATTGITATVFNPTGGTVTSNLHCIAIHP